MRVMECINIRPKQIGAEKKENCKFTNVQVLNLLILFPFFVVRNAVIDVNPKFHKLYQMYNLYAA